MAHWFTDRICWRYIVPAPRYFRELRIGRVAPELRGELNRIRWLMLSAAVLLVPVAILILPFLMLRWVSDLVLDARLGIMPDFTGMRERAVEEALRKVPLKDLKERLGETATTILPKKPQLAEEGK